MVKRRRNPAFPHEHPWMTLFLGFAALETVRVIVRGWEPPLVLDKPAPALPAAPPATVAPTTITGFRLSRAMMVT